MKKLLRLIFLLQLCLPALPALAFDLNGVALGGKELDVKKAFPSTRCKALEWKTDAADRRCDDAKAPVGGIPTLFTVFLKAGVIQAYDIRFDIKELDRMKEHLRSRWGAPLSEATEIIARRDKEDRKVFKMRWDKGADRAILAAQLEKKRGTLEVSRGTFPEEVYRVK